MLLRGAGSRLQGSVNDSVHLRFCLNSFLAVCQSSEHAARNFANLRS